MGADNHDCDLERSAGYSVLYPAVESPGLTSVELGSPSQHELAGLAY